ncbi:uncharacterized protein RJT21DRAFT_48187 [Scheffersomyces amazonensis]|uniref:uncharacterized protein n=1 Tax=Scheffersomyces amazonensis TaxID=1078765 RepID=UPI00315CB612
MLKYIFGTQDSDNVSLQNEPTVDYNNTIYSFNTPNNATNYDIPNDYRKSSWAPSVIPNIIDYSDDELESDDDIRRDFKIVRDNFTRTSNQLNQNYNYQESSNFSLPTNYPGKYVSNEHEEYHNKPRKEENLDYRRSVLPNFSGEYININTDYVKSDTQVNIDKEIAQLKEGVKKELKNKNSSPQEIQDVQLSSIIVKIKNQNKFLHQLNDIIDLDDELPENLLNKYNNLKADYIKELKNSQIFYQVYSKLLTKYRQLRKEGASSATTILTSTSKSKSVLSLKEKVKLIRSLSNQSSIKITCSNILNELDKLEDKDKTIDELRKKLDDANLKIQTLEKTNKQYSSKLDS